MPIPNLPAPPTGHKQPAWSAWTDAVAARMPAVLDVPARSILHVLPLADRSDTTVLLRTITKDLTVGAALRLNLESDFLRVRYGTVKREIAKAIQLDAEGMVARKDALWIGMTQEEITGWLARHHLPGIAHMPVNRLPIPSGRFKTESWIGRREQPVATWLSAPPTSGHRQVGPGHTDQVMVANFVSGVALDPALLVTRALVPLPSDPQLARLVSTLRHMRADLAAKVGVRPPWDHTAQVAVTLEPPGITWMSTDGIGCEGTFARANGRLDLDRMTVSCNCRTSPCAATVATLDAADTLLCGPIDGPLSALVEALRTPAWKRALGHLDRVLDDAATETTRDVLGFRFRDSVIAAGTLFDIRATRTQPGGKTRLISLDEAETLAHTAKEREAIDRIHDTDWARAMAALSGHPRVIYGDGSSAKNWQRFDVGVDTLNVSLIGLPDESVQLTPRLGKLETTAQELVRHLSVASDDTAGPIMWVNHAARRVHVWQPDAATRALVAWMNARTTTFPAEAVPEILRRLPTLARTVPLHVDEAFRGEPMPADSTPILRLAEIDDGFTLTLRVRPLPEAPTAPPGEGSTLVLVERDGLRLHAMRDLDEELDRAQVVAHALGVEGSTDDEKVFSGADAVTLLSRLPTLEGVAVEWSSAPRRVHRARLGGLQLQVRQTRDWFGVTGSVQLDGDTLSLDALLETLRLGRRFVRLESGDYAEITDTLARRLTEATDGAFIGKRGIEVSEWTAPALLSLADDGVALEVDDAFRLRLDRLHESAALEWTPPERVAPILRSYQTDGVSWLIRTAHWSEGAVLADDMGLGKTLQALLLLEQRASDGPALVIAPTSVGFSWIREAARFAPSLRIVLARDENRGAVHREVGPHDVLVTSYTLLLRDVEALCARTWHTLVLDEAHALKNAASQRAHAAASLKADFTLALTGTPVENRPEELWSLFRRITPGLLGSAERFRQRFGDGSVDSHAALSRLVRPFILRRKKTEVATDLPSRTEVQVDVDLSPPERALYDEMRKAAIALSRDGGGAPAGTKQLKVLAAITRLRQAALHPRLVEPTSALASSKLTRLMELLRELRDEGERTLVFSQFTSLLDLLYPLLADAGFTVLTLDGSTPEAERRRRVDAFQRGEADVFVLSLKAGGVGLTLTAASSVIHLDPWWNPAVEDQATDRAHRIGQTRPVTVYRLVARGTIEEAILALHGDKRTMVAQMLEGTGATAALRTDDLLALLSGADEPTDAGPVDAGDAVRLAIAAARGAMAATHASDAQTRAASVDDEAEFEAYLASGAADDDGDGGGDADGDEEPPVRALASAAGGSLATRPTQGDAVRRDAAEPPPRRAAGAVPPSAAPTTPRPVMTPPDRTARADLRSGEVTRWFEEEAARGRLAGSSAMIYAGAARRLLSGGAIPESARAEQIDALVDAWIDANQVGVSSARTMRAAARHVARWWAGRGR